MAGVLAGRKKVQINKNNYDILPHPTTEGLIIVRKLISYMAIGNDNPMDFIAKIAFKSIEEDPNLELLMELFKYTQINETQINREKLDDHFAGNYKELIDALMEVFKTNNFLDLAKAIGGLSM